MQKMDSFWKEPLLHFLIIGALIFGLDAFVLTDKKERILLDKKNIDFLVKNQQNLLLRELSESETDELITTHINNEILYREAYRRGLNQNDSRMRHNMILKMRGMLISDIETPTEEQLKLYYQQNIQKYTTEELLHIEHLYFSDANKVPKELLIKLNSDSEFVVSSDIYRPTLGQKDFKRPIAELVGLIGSEATKSLVDAKSSQWLGPFEFETGIHFARRKAVIAPIVASYEEVTPYLTMDWETEEAQKLIAQEIDNVRGQYQIIVER